MFNKIIKNKRKNTENKPKEKGPEFYSFALNDLEKYWSDNNYQIPHFNTWDELYLFLKDDSKSLASKLEILNNLNCDEEFYGITMPDYFWQDKTLNRKVRALCRFNSKTYASINGYCYYKKLVEDLDDELFLGICELQNGIYILLDDEKVTTEQKEQIVKSAINFKKSYKKQDESHEFTLLKALELDCFSEEFKAEIYEAEKENMIKTTHYADRIFKTFLNKFFSDSTVTEEDKIKIINKALPKVEYIDFTDSYLFYLGNPNIPSYIQKIVLNHFVNATGKNLERSHPETFEHINLENFINILNNPEIPLDLKSKMINYTTNPLIVCYAMTNEEMDENITELLKVKLETMKIPETKEVLEVIRILLTNPEASKKVLKIK